MVPPLYPCVSQKNHPTGPDGWPAIADIHIYEWKALS